MHVLHTTKAAVTYWTVHSHGQSCNVHQYSSGYITSMIKPLFVCARERHKGSWLSAEGQQFDRNEMQHTTWAQTILHTVHFKWQILQNPDWKCRIIRGFASSRIWNRGSLPSHCSVTTLVLLQGCDVVCCIEQESSLDYTNAKMHLFPLISISKVQAFDMPN